jgi:hypothetical protein
MQKFSYPDIQPLVTNPPIFRNDKMALPLQAADLHAWWAHRMMTAYFTDQPMRRPPLPGKKEALAVPMLEMLWTEERLKRMRRSLTPYITYSEPLQISGQFQEPWRVSVTPERSS